MSEKRIPWKTTDNRFVAFFDILGFKDLVARSTHNEVYKKMLALSETQKFLKDTMKETSLYSNGILYSTSFSDSLIVFSRDNSIKSFEAISMTAAFIMADSFISGIPIKGAISEGIVSINKPKNIYFGQALIDAYTLQEELQYYGIVAHHSVEKYIYNNKLGIREDVQNDYFEIETPFKTGYWDHINLNWFQSTGQKDGASIKSVALKLLDEIKLSVSGHPRKYIDNTRKVINHVYP